MGDPVSMNHNQQFTGVPRFLDDQGNEQAVDAVRWTISDPMGGQFSQNGNDVSYVADATMAPGSEPRTAQMRCEVDEAGVANAFFDTFDVTIHGPANPAATRMEVNFSVTDQP